MAFEIPGVEPGSDIESLFKAMGFVAVQWGFVEQSLDLLVASIFHAVPGHPLMKQRPKNLEPKVEFLCKCFAELPALGQFAAEANPLLDRFLAVGKKRNDLMHGAIASLETEDGAFQFLKVDVRHEHALRSVYLSNAEWVEFRRELIRLGREGQALAAKVGRILQ
jgi:hypothetical protein